MIYFFVLALLFFIAPLDRARLRNTYIIAMFLVLLVFLAARWETGTDWESYIEYFKDLDNYRNFEPGFVFENEVVRLFTDNYTVFLFINGALALAPIAWFLRKESHGSIALSLSLFYAYYYLITYFGASRRIIAIGLCVLAAMQLLEKRHKLALLLVFLGSSFHYSAMLCVFYFPIANYRPTTRDAFRLITLIGAFFYCCYFFFISFSKIYPTKS